MRDAQSAVDLTNCAQEPIHIPGAVQDHGCLIALTRDWSVSHASANTADILGLRAEKILGRPFVDIFPSEVVHCMRSKLQSRGETTIPARLFGIDVLDNGRICDVAAHSYDGLNIFEFEPRIKAAEPDTLGQLQALFSRIKSQPTMLRAAQQTVRVVKALTGFDRVMMYQFQDDYSGAVIAEAVELGYESFLGLRFPEGDIPPQARALYTRNILRLIGDVDGTVHPIHATQEAKATPLDLSLATTRAVSPIHLQYLRNMDVAGSMSISILRHGKLWGLIACHHRAPFVVSQAVRSQLELLSQLFSYDLADKDLDIERTQASRARALHNNMVGRVSTGADLFAAFDTIAGEVADVIPHDGIVLFSGDRVGCLGVTPSEQAFRSFAKGLGERGVTSVIVTDQIGKDFPDLTLPDPIAGFMALPISRQSRDFIVLFRKEKLQTVTWAGHPEDGVKSGPVGTELTPRASFEKWTESVAGRCQSWNAVEVLAAETLRGTLLEVILKVADQNATMQAHANERQELLIAELNHRVRNILNLIRGVISRSQMDAMSVPEFSQIIDGRIQALARAHNLLTERGWGPTSILHMLEVEVSGFTAEDTDRLVITGPDARLDARAFSTVALALHEVVTNSAKYGALSVPEGCVKLTTQFNDHGDLVLHWEDVNGPPVKPPAHRGFGTVIIEKTVAFELGGETQTSFEPAGFQARFTIPAKFVTRSDKNQSDVVRTRIERKVPLRDDMDVLLVEDNLIIAMDTRDMIMELGAREVHVAGNVSDALHILDTANIGFAVLDVNLGQGYSHEVADVLDQRDIPFVLATGYSEETSVLAAYPPAPILNKPYSKTAVRNLFAEQDGASLK